MKDDEYEQTVLPKGACEKQQSSGASLFASIPTYEYRLREACEALDLESPNSDNTITDRMRFFDLPLYKYHRQYIRICI